MKKKSVINKVGEKIPFNLLNKEAVGIEPWDEDFLQQIQYIPLFET